MSRKMWVKGEKPDVEVLVTLADMLKLLKQMEEAHSNYGEMPLPTNNGTVLCIEYTEDPK